MKTTLIRITIATAAITVLGLSACSAGAETKPAGNTQAVSTSQAGARGGLLAVSAARSGHAAPY